MAETPEQWLSIRLQAAGIDPTVPIEYGAKPLIEHADRIGQPAQTWLERFEPYVRTLHSIPLDFWPAIHFCVPFLARAAGDKAEAFGNLLSEVGELLTELHRKGVPPVRTVEYGVRFAAEALGSGNQALSAVLATGRRLATRGQDPGWLMQIAIPELWHAAAQETVFCRWVHLVEIAATALADMGVSIGYPWALGLAALAGHGQSLRTCLASWLERIVRVARSMVENDLQPYGWFEYGLAGLSAEAGFPAGEVTRALDIALDLADRAINSGDLLQASFGLGGDDAPQTVDSFLDAAERLSRSGIDPFFVLTCGLAQNAVLLPRASDGGDPRERVLALAEQLHAHGYPLRTTFEDGLPTLREMDQRWPGLFSRGFDLAERLVRAGADPGMVLAAGMPRALRGADTRPWLERECIEWAAELAGAGADPEPALSYAVPPMLDIAGTEEKTFQSLRAALQDFIASLAHSHVDYRDVLFYDISALAGNQVEESEAFIALLSRLGDLVRLLLQFHYDPGPVLIKGLPIAASASVHHAWVMEECLEAGIRLAAEGRDPGPFLEHAARPLAEAAGEDRGALRQLCTVVERRTRGAPDEVWPAVQASAGVSGGRAEWLDEALTAILQYLPKRDEPADARQELILALPQLSGMATDPKGLASLMRTFRREASSFAEDEAPRSAWLRYGVEACAILVGKDPSAGSAALHDLARLSRTWGALAVGIMRHCARAAAEIAGRDGRFFLDAMAACAAAAGRLETIEAQDALPALVSVAAAAGRGRRDRWMEALDLPCQVLCQPGPEQARLVDDLAYARQLLDRWENAWDSLMAPLLRAHGRYAGSLFYALTQAPPQMVRDISDLDVLRDLVTQTGVRALDILCNLVIPAVYRGTIQKLADHRECLQGFVKDVGCWDAELYRSYWQIVANASLSASERRSRIDALRKGFTGLAAAIRSGSVLQEQERHPLFLSAMAYVFPPSVSATLQMYGELYAGMPDRPEDVSGRDPGPELRQRTYALGGGSWQLRAGATKSASVWEPALAALRVAAASGASAESSAKLGWDLLRLWSEGRLGKAEVKAALWPRLLGTVGAAGDHLPQEAGTAAQLQEIARVFSDRMRDAVEEALVASKRQDQDMYDRLVKEKMAPKARAGPELMKSVWQQIERYRGSLVEEEEAIRRLSHQLRRFAVDQAVLKEILAGVDSINALRALLEQIGPRRADPLPGREVQRMHAELAGQEVSAMQRELFGGPRGDGLLEYRKGSLALELTCELTKRRIHAAVGFTEGVCVATDVALWNNPDFLQVAFWNSDGICRGGMHLLAVEAAGDGYLTLPGINPSRSLLEIVEASTMLDTACDYAWRLARAWGMKGVWIPAAQEIHSNRQAMREAIAKRRWKTRSVQTIAFSREPFAYSFAEVLEIPRGL
jgi:hypothetical protein